MLCVGANVRLVPLPAFVMTIGAAVASKVMSPFGPTLSLVVVTLTLVVFRLLLMSASVTVAVVVGSNVFGVPPLNAPPVEVSVAAAWTTVTSSGSRSQLPVLPFGARVSTRAPRTSRRSEEHTSELQSRLHLVCRLLLEKKKKT